MVQAEEVSSECWVDFGRCGFSTVVMEASTIVMEASAVVMEASAVVMEASLLPCFQVLPSSPAASSQSWQALQPAGHCGCQHGKSLHVHMHPERP